MNKEKLRGILETVRTISVIGAKDVPGQPVDRVGRYLIRAGYTVIPVHPKRKTVWGLPAFAGLAEIPVPVDLVNVFRAPEYCAEHAREVLKLLPLPRLFWMQLGITNAEAVSLLAEQGVPVVEDACLMVEHSQIFGLPRVD
jgi:predicted CoA-binding protein